MLVLMIKLCHLVQTLAGCTRSNIQVIRHLFYPFMSSLSSSSSSSLSIMKTRMKVEFSEESETQTCSSVRRLLRRCSSCSGCRSCASEVFEQRIKRLINKRRRFVEQFQYAVHHGVYTTSSYNSSLMLRSTDSTTQSTPLTSIHACQLNILIHLPPAAAACCCVLRGCYWLWFTALSARRQKHKINENWN